MNNDLISREALLKAMEEERQYLLARGLLGAEHILVHHCLPLIDNAPTVELLMGRMVNGIIIPIERPQGEWIAGERNGDGYDYYCSRCMQVTLEDINRIKFCPHCGAEMR